MSKVDEYTGNGMIVVSDGEVWAVDDSGLPDVIGEIGRVELSIEMPENLIGIYRVEHIMLFDEDDEELYDDQTLVDNTEYHSERALVKAVAKKYGISEDIMGNCFIKDNIAPQKTALIVALLFVCKNKGGMIN